MTCDRYFELLSARLDGALTREEERELEEHFAVCPDCRALADQLAQLRDGFSGLEELEAPAGFAQGVMDRVREETRPKVVPLFKRPQVRALAGLAACLVLAVGLYGASRPHHEVNTRIIHLDDAVDVQSRSVDSPRVNADLVDPQLEDAPQIASYAAPEDGAPGQRTVPNPAADGMEDDWPLMEGTTTLERMPEGAAELIPPETVVVPMDGQGGSVYLDLPLEVLDEIEWLAREQGIGITAERCSAPGAEVVYNLEILQLNQ